ncbi:MAG: cytochrome ubiquinol oxidase subunit I [Nitrospirae bacterium]|nr:cytochrome ubiquinol oxidase subunit I [Nitrospirota bacterium]MBI3594948.1 cytochrome ubiquinol oxidase subunit I [Nitrospirota bacterium]
MKALKKSKNFLSLALLGILFLSLFSFAIPLFFQSKAYADEAAAPAAPVMGKDVYYKNEGPVSGPPAPKLKVGDYPMPNLPGVAKESRLIVWVIGQQHLYFGSFVLAVPIFCMVIELIGLLTKDPVASKRYDQLAYDFIKISLTAYSVTAILGGLLIFTFITMYPGFFAYLASLFRPFMHIYALLFLAESGTLYLYYYGWHRMEEGFLKWVHATLGILLNVFGTILMMLANSWLSYMMSPAGVDEKGQFLGNYAHLLHSALWNPINVHRIIGNMVFGGGIVAAYSAYKFLSSKTKEEKAYYDWMGYISMFFAVGSLIPLPFAGYWLMREVYAYRQQMGITLMGGLLAWLFILQAVLIGSLFFSVIYYLFNGMQRMKGAERYEKITKYIFFGVTAAFLVWLTPHTLVMTGSELKAIGGQQHPVVGNFGVMSAKNGAVNTMLILTVLTFVIYQRANKEITVKWKNFGNAMLFTMFGVALANNWWLAIYGYYIPANVRVGLSVPQVAGTLTCLFVGTAINVAMMKGAKSTGPVLWGTISNRSQFAIFALAVSFTWLMALMGYVRSSVRLFWHVMEIMRDNSPWAFTHPIGFASNMMSVNVIIFWIFTLFVFSLAELSSGHREVPSMEDSPVAKTAGRHGHAIAGASE